MVRGAAMNVVSLNMAKEVRLEPILADFERVPEVKNADIYLVQEVAQPGPGSVSVAEQLGSALKLNVAFAPAKSGVTDQGLAILSRYPIRDVTVRSLKACDLLFRSRSRIGLAATVDTPSGALRVYDVHLDTRVNPSERLAQLASVVEDSMRFSGPRLIGGDFNTNDLYWVGHVLPIPAPRVQANAVRTFMTSYGFSAPYQGAEPTFDMFGFHLDWLFLNHLQADKSAIYPMNFSDHHALRLRVSGFAN
jgi:endonuclease/exonuclease/phosphatase family metal-dependent hydrolase